jgi:hypothetical protein
MAGLWPIAGIGFGFGARLLCLTVRRLLLMGRVLVVVVSEVLCLLRWAFAIPCHAYSKFNNVAARRTSPPGHLAGDARDPREEVFVADLSAADHPRRRRVNAVASA